jgi:PAS domain S-box-containing protein
LFFTDVNAESSAKGERISVKSGAVIPEQVKATIDETNSKFIRERDSVFTGTLDELKGALFLSQKYGYQKGEITAYGNLFYYYSINRDYLKVIEYFFKTIESPYAQIDSSVLIIPYTKVGKLFLNLSKPDRAEKYLHQALRLCDKFHDSVERNVALIYIGEMALRQNDVKKAYRYYYEALDKSSKLKNKKHYGWSLNQFGLFYLNIKDYDKSLEYFQKALTAYQKMKYESGLGSTYSNIAYVYYLKADYRKELYYNELAYRIRKKLGQKEFMANSLINIGDTYLKLEDYSQAFYYLSAGLAASVEIGKFYLLEPAYEKLYNYYTIKKDWIKALETYKLYTSARDSVFKLRNKEETAIYEANQIISENEEKNERLATENQLQKLQLQYTRSQIVFVLLVLLITILIAVFLFMQFRVVRKSKHQLELLNAKLASEIEERSKAELQLRQSEELHRFLTNNSQDVICRLNAEFNLTFISPSCEKLYGYSQDEMMVLGTEMHVIDPDFLAVVQERLREIIRRQEPDKLTYRFTTKEGTKLWAESHVNPIFNTGGSELTEMICVVRDITGRINQEEALRDIARHQELLMREIHHRAKNNFAILNSLINMQKYQEQNKTLTPILVETQTRIRTMVIIHEQLYRNNSVDVVAFGDYLKNLITTVSSAYKRDGIHLHTDVDECQMNIEFAIPLGLIANEMLTNAYKYAFGEHGAGNIFVDFHAASKRGRAKQSNSRWEMVIHDDGKGLPEGYSIETASSTGSQIITALVGQLHGSLAVSNNRGAWFTLLVEIPDVS